MPTFSVSRGWGAHIVEYLKRSLVDRYSEFFTTPIFKMSGIQGWREYRTSVSVEGEIKQVAHSLDGMTSVDMDVRPVSMNGQVSPIVGHRFLRMEVFGCVGRDLQTNLLPGQRVQIYGKLMWDGDSFLEVHPSSDAGIRDLNSPSL